MKTVGNTLLLTAAAVVTLAGISAARAGIIYQDNFGRGSSTDALPLYGSTPAPTDVQGVTWSAGVVGGGSTGGPTTNGSAAVFSSSFQQYASLPLTLQPNETYAFTVTITPTAGSTSNWLAMAFGNGTTNLNIDEAGEAWLLYRDTGGTESFYGGSTSNGTAGGTATSGAADTFTITLTTPADLTTGSADVTMYDSLGLIGSSTNPFVGSLTPAQLANVNGIIIGNYSVAGTFSGLELTAAAVPEPEALALLGVGGAGLLLLGRRCRVL